MATRSTPFTALACHLTFAVTVWWRNNILIYVDQFCTVFAKFFLGAFRKTRMQKAQPKQTPCETWLRVLGLLDACRATLRPAAAEGHFGKTQLSDCPQSACPLTRFSFDWSDLTCNLRLSSLTSFAPVFILTMRSCHSTVHQSAVQEKLIIYTNGLFRHLWHGGLRKPVLRS